MTLKRRFTPLFTADFWPDERKKKTITAGGVGGRDLLLAASGGP